MFDLSYDYVGDLAETISLIWSESLNKHDISLSSLISKLNNDKLNLEKSGSSLKLPFGPIIGPNPGPTLEIDVAAPEIAVIKSRPLKDSRAARVKKITK